MFKHVLFDLDGTLTRSHVGILRSVEYALNREGESTVDRLRQEVVIGPPLMYTFTHTYGFSKDKARRLYDYFQERYGTVGIFENEPYYMTCKLREYGRMWLRRSRRFTQNLFASISA